MFIGHIAHLQELYLKFGQKLLSYLKLLRVMVQTHLRNYSFHDTNFIKKRMWYIHCVPKLKPWNHQFVSRCAPLIALYPVKPYARFERILPKCSREEGKIVSQYQCQIYHLLSFWLRWAKTTIYIHIRE